MANIFIIRYGYWFFTSIEPLGHRCYNVQALCSAQCVQLSTSCHMMNKARMPHITFDCYELFRIRKDRIYHLVLLCLNSGSSSLRDWHSCFLRCCSLYRFNISSDHSVHTQKIYYKVQRKKSIGILQKKKPQSNVTVGYILYVGKWLCVCVRVVAWEKGSWMFLARETNGSRFLQYFNELLTTSRMHLGNAG